jgi:hypothetical protein
MAKRKTDNRSDDAKALDDELERIAKVYEETSSDGSLSSYKVQRTEGNTIDLVIQERGKR